MDPHAPRQNLERLHADNPEGSVVAQADELPKNGLLVLVMDPARQAGIESVAIADEVVD